MKKHLLLLALSMQVVISAWSQGACRTMLVEGRSWKILMVTQTWEVDTIYEDIKVVEMEDVLATTYVTYTITGETEVEGKPCYCISRSSYNIAKVDPERYSEVVELPNPVDVFYMYEEDGKVYSYTPNFSDGWQLEFDSNLQPGEAVSNNRVVDSIDAINVNGEVYRRFTFKDGSCWIEGIGSPKYGMLNVINSELDSEITVLKMKTVSIFDNGNSIFEADDFNAEAQEIFTSDDSSSEIPTDIYSANRSTDNILAMPMYDLQGRRLTHKPQKGVYIRDGRKVLVK